jgi:hypothetical protein
LNLEELDKSAVIKTDSLKANISIEEITNNPDISRKMPEELKYYFVRAKQSSNLVEQKLMTEALKVYNHMSNKVEKLLVDIDLKYASKQIDRHKENVFKENYKPMNYYDGAYKDLKGLCEYMNSINEISLLGESEKEIVNEFHDV